MWVRPSDYATAHSMGFGLNRMQIKLYLHEFNCLAFEASELRSGTVLLYYTNSGHNFRAFFLHFHDKNKCLLFLSAHGIIVVNV